MQQCPRDGPFSLVQGYKAQSEMVMESLDRLISSCAARHESLVCEGVHLSLNFVVQLMQRHPSIVPFLIYISNEDKHKERFAVRLSVCLSVSLSVCLSVCCLSVCDLSAFLSALARAYSNKY